MRKEFIDLSEVESDLLSYLIYHGVNDPKSLTDALEDGEFLSSLEHEQSTIESLHHAIGSVPWSCHVESCDGGLMAFESEDDYDTWQRQS